MRNVRLFSWYHSRTIWCAY